LELCDPSPALKSIHQFSGCLQTLSHQLGLLAHDGQGIVKEYGFFHAKLSGKGRNGRIRVGIGQNGGGFAVVRVFLEGDLGGGVYCVAFAGCSGGQVRRDGGCEGMDGEPIDVASSSAKDNGVLCYLGLVYVPHARNTRSLRFFRELQQDDADGFIYIRVQQFIPPVICSICTYTEALELNGLRLSIGHENRGSGWDVNNHQLPSLLGSSLLDPDVPAFPMTYIHTL
jgi:hypothetical protein